MSKALNQMTPEELFDKIEAARAEKRAVEAELHPLEEAVRLKIEADEPLDKEEFVKMCNLKKKHAEIMKAFGKLV